MVNRRKQTLTAQAQRLELSLLHGRWSNAFIGLVLQQIGLITTSVTNAGFLTGLYVVMVPVLGVIIFRSWPHPVVWPSAIACLTGIFLLSGGELSALKQGDWLVIAGAVFWAMQVLLISRANRAGRPITLSCVQFATAAVAGLLIAAAIEDINWNVIALTGKNCCSPASFHPALPSRCKPSANATPPRRRLRFSCRPKRSLQQCLAQFSLETG